MEKATREAYGEVLAEIGKDTRIVALDADLSESTKSISFAEKYPERFFNFGVAEANMMSAAAGLAIRGKIPFASTFAVFATGRAYDQLRSIAYARLNVRIVGTHSGISVGEDGPTHHATEDIALMRALPNMLIISPSDAVETKKAIKAILDLKGPVYIRLGRPKLPQIYDENYEYEFGKASMLREGNDISIIATGIMVHESLEAAKLLQENGINARVINISTIKPIDSKAILKAAADTGRILACEDHSVNGGLGSAILEVLADNNAKCKVRRLGIRDCFTESASPKELFEKYGLNAKSVANEARKMFA